MNSESSNGSEDERASVMDSGSDEEVRILLAPQAEQGVGDGIIVQTAFDTYFAHTAARSQTSSNVFSSIVPPITQEEYAEAMALLPQKDLDPILFTPDARPRLFRRLMRELDEGFNLLCYGLGSKRRVLNQFALDFCSKRGHIVVANAFQTNFTLKAFLSSIEAIPGLSGRDEQQSSSVESQARRICHAFNDNATKRPLYLIIHNIDAAPLRSPKAKGILASLALTSRIHIIASIDHINAPLLWSSSELSARKSDDPLSTPIPPARGFAWLWHDMTTLSPYDFELASVDRSSISGAHGGGAGRRKIDNVAMGTATVMSETAAMHILASVTQKAKKLFLLMAGKQLESIEGEEDPSVASDLQQFSIAYDALFNLARENFVAANDTALRSLLGEFRDHGLVVGAQAGPGGGEVLWIPLRKERLVVVLGRLQSESAEN